MTEHTAMKFAMYFMGEYIAMNTASAVIITMIFGGYNLPWVSTTFMLEHFYIFAVSLMVAVPIIIRTLILWMKKNNSVRSTVSTDAGRNFETKVLTIVMISMAIFIEIILLYLALISQDALMQNIAITLFQIVVFVIKLMMFNIFFIIIRWTVPRFRYDQVQKLGWYYLLPLALVNIFITAIIVVGAGL
jgi:NADH-quinone oxidoreductase subunit H